MNLLEKSEMDFDAGPEYQKTVLDWLIAYRRGLRYEALNLCFGDQDLADDFVQATYLRVLKNFNLKPEENGFGGKIFKNQMAINAYLKKVLRNLYFDYVRRPNLIVLAESSDLEVEDGLTGEVHFSHFDSLDRVFERLKTISPEEIVPFLDQAARECFSNFMDDHQYAQFLNIKNRRGVVVYFLRSMLNLEYDEIINLMKMPAGTVMINLYRMRRIIAKIMGFDLDDKKKTASFAGGEVG